jgi:hypothetical protein
MENKVGDKIPSPQEIKKLTEELEAIHKQLESWCIDLSPEERAGGPRFRTGGAQMAELLHKIAKNHGVSVKGADLDGMMADLRVLEAAGELAKAAGRISQRLADTGNEAEREAAEVFHKVYGRLSNMAETDATLANEIQPIVEHLASPRRKKT